jgi:hypothetical protein
VLPCDARFNEVDDEAEERFDEQLMLTTRKKLAELLRCRRVDVPTVRVFGGG